MVYATSAAGMAREMISLLKSTECRQELEHAGLNYVRHNCSYEKITHQLETILEEVINEKQDEAISKRI